MGKISTLEVSCAWLAYTGQVLLYNNPFILGLVAAAFCS